MIDRSVAVFAVGAAVCAAAVAWAYAEGRRQALKDQSTRSEGRADAAAARAAGADATAVAAAGVHDAAAEAPAQEPAAAPPPPPPPPAAAAAPPPPPQQQQQQQQQQQSAQQQQTLEKLYQQIARDFAATGLDVAAVRQLQQWFDHATDGGLPWPKPYAKFDPPLPPRAVRLVALPLADASPAACALGARATAAIARLLPPGVKCFSNARASYHSTLFQLSNYLDPRPDPLKADGGLFGSHQQRPAAERPGPSPAALERELQALARVFAAAAPFELRLERIAFARSGTLLLLWRDEPAGAAAALRAALREAFAGASDRQPVTIHSTLMRVVTAAPLGDDVVASIVAEAEAWTQKARGIVVPARAVWRVIEEEYSTIAGERDVFRLGGGGG